jgi:hypothetical protein
VRGPGYLQLGLEAHTHQGVERFVLDLHSVCQLVPMQEQEPRARAAIAQVDRDLRVASLKLDVLEAFEHMRPSCRVDSQRIHTP